MVSFCRIDERSIRVREPIARPDFVVVGDPTLLHQVAVFEGLSDDGYVLINSGREPDELGLGDLVAGLPDGHVVTVPASELAREHLGRPLPNAALLGGFAGLCDEVGLESVRQAIHERFPGPIGEGNAGAAGAAFAYVEREAAAHA